MGYLAQKDPALVSGRTAKRPVERTQWVGTFSVQMRDQRDDPLHLRDLYQGKGPDQVKAGRGVGGKLCRWSDRVVGATPPGWIGSYLLRR